MPSSSRKTPRSTPGRPRRKKGRPVTISDQEDESASESEKSRKTSRSRSPSPNKGRSSTSKSLQHNERSNVKGKRPHSIENRSKQRRRDESDVDDEDMETRSAKKKQFTPSVKPNDTSTPRSRRTSARTRPPVKQDQLNKPYSDKIEPTSETETEFKDTPKHLYGLDSPKQLSSGDESVNVESDISTCSPQKKFKQIKRFFTVRLRRLMNCKCIGVALCIAFIAVAVVSALLMPFPHFDLPTVKVDMEQQAQESDELKWNTKSLKELQEKLDQLSASLKTIKEDSKKVLYNESLNSKQHLSRYIDGLINDKMEAALDTYSADKLGIPDYALESSGGQIHSNHHSPTFNTGASRKLLGLSFWYDGVLPRAILQPDNTPGTCWAFKGQEGYVVVELSQTVNPEMFTLEHIPASLSTEGDGKITSAPKEFSVWGWSDSQGTDRKCFGKYTFDNQGKSLQTFKVQEPNDQEYRYIELRVATNHGHPTHTCIYRFRVHGKPTGATLPCNEP